MTILIHKMKHATRWKNQTKHKAEGLSSKADVKGRLRKRYLEPKQELLQLSKVKTAKFLMESRSMMQLLLRKVNQVMMKLAWFLI